MRVRLLFCAAMALTVAACGQPSSQEPGYAPGADGEGATTESVAETFDLPPVDPTLVAAPSTDFAAVEPSELGVYGAPTIAQAVEPLIAAGVHGSGGTQENAEESAEAPVEGADEPGGGGLQLTVSQSGASTIADIVRAIDGDDSIAAAHLRIEFQENAEGWYPINAYRRWQCRRGATPGAWSATPCP